MRHLILLVLISLCLADNIPELKTSMSFKALKKVATDTLKPLADKYLPGLKVPLNLNVQKKIPVLGTLTLKTQNMKLDNYTLNWDNLKFVPFSQKSNNQVYINIDKLSANITMDLFVQLGKSVLVDQSATLRIDNVTQTLSLRFDDSDPDNSWGFIPVILDSTTNIDKLSIKFAKPNLKERIFNVLFNMIISSVPKIAKNLIVNTLGPKLAELAKSSQIKFKLPLSFLKPNYQISIALTQAPFIKFSENDANFNLHVDLELKNLDTGAVCPQFNEAELSDRVYNDYEDIELMLGDNLVNQLLWVVVDSKVLNLVIGQKQIDSLKSLPIELTTTGLKIISSSFADVYGENKYMYLSLSTTDLKQNVYFRTGRLVGGLQLRIGFIVDLDSSTEKALDYKDCKSCVIAHQTDASLSLMLTAFNNEETLAASVMEIIFTEMASADPTSTFPFNDKQVAELFNGLITTFVSQLNQIANKGIKNPLVGKFGIKVFDLLMADTFVATSLLFD